MNIPNHLAAELANHPGVTARMEHGRKHHRLFLMIGGRSRFVTLSASASDWRAQRNQIGDMRRVIRELML